MAVSANSFPAPTGSQVGANALEWMHCNTFADIAGISPRHARRIFSDALAGIEWKGVKLVARKDEGQTVLVSTTSLPQNLQDIWHKRYSPSAPASSTAAQVIAPPTSSGRKMAEDYSLWQLKLQIIAPALQHKKGSRQRGEIMRSIAAKEFARPNGEQFRPRLSTLYAWIEKAEVDGDTALLPAKRRESKSRVLISRAWEESCPLSKDTKIAIAEHMVTHVKSLWAAGTPGRNRVQQLAAIELLEQCRNYGWKGATLENCTPGEHFIKKFSKFAEIAIKEQNAKRFHDKYTPRIVRHRMNLRPLDIVIGDVHPIDVVRNIDGRMVHARLISWLDLATYDVFVSPVFCEPGTNIRQEHIAASFADMADYWGLPRLLRIDNGKEYAWKEMDRGFNELAGLLATFDHFHYSLLSTEEVSEIRTDFNRAISRARPYNAQAKQIESLFGNLERGFFSFMPGWVGGDRMNKRTQNVGQAPRAWEGTDEKFAADLESVLNLYRVTVQSDGASPNDRWRNAVAAGHQKVSVSRETLVFAFSELRKGRVNTNGIEVGNALYWCDDLIPYINHRVEYRYAKWAPDYILLGDKTPFIAIPRSRSYGQQDGEGAIEQSRRHGLKLLEMRSMKAQTKPVNLIEEASRLVAEHPPHPEIPIGPTITTAAGENVAKALENMASPRTLSRLQPGQMQTESGEIIDLQPTQPKEPKADAAAFDPFAFSTPNQR